MTAAAPATAEALARLCDALRGGGVASLSLADNSLGPHATALLARGLAGNASLLTLPLALALALTLTQTLTPTLTLTLTLTRQRQPHLSPARW